MTQHLSPARPALAAIAAVIGLQSTAAIAQTVDAAPPVNTAPPVIAAPPVLNAPAPANAQPAPAQTPQGIFQPSSPVVQPVPERSVPVAEAEAEPAPPAAVTPRERARATAPREATERQAAPVATLTPPSATPSEVRPNTTETAIVAPPPVVAPETAAPLALPDDTGSDTALWLLGLGALGVLAGGALIAARRSRSDNSVALKPKGEFEAVNPSQRFVMGQEEVGTATPPASVMVPATSVAPASTVAVASRDRPRRTEGLTGLAEQREAFAAAAPSPENPFLTRKNRLRRANFLLSHQRADSMSSESRDADSVDAHNGRHTHEEVRQVSYSFSNGALKPPVLKPRFN